VIQIEGAGDLADPAPFSGAIVVGVTGGTSTPIEDLEKVAERVYSLGGTDERSADAERLAHAALTQVAEPAYRSTSLGVKAAQRRTPVAGAA